MLAVLRERPMHPYEIQRLLKQRRKDDVLVLKRGSLYHAIRRLSEAGLIKEGETTREGLRPERTTYALTSTGEAALTDWLKQLVAIPRKEKSSFMGSLSFLIHLDPAEAIAALDQRVAQLDRQIAETGQVIKDVSRRIGRIHLIESEYARAMHAAEAAWVRKLIADLRDGTLTWNLKAMMAQLRAPVDQKKAPSGGHRDGHA
ncbi:MAG TPA: PadR family transcriptional regulator [Opitutaceae bacterium]|nr:PadR family transcriptional regulator [Opitutaceae bacterium]